MSIDKIKTGDDLTQSLDIVSDNISKLKELFPEAIIEGKIDFKVLQDILGNEIEEDDEFYRFTWAGKSQSRREAHKPSTGTLRPCKEESVDWDTTQNLYIEGDNLEVLKLLQKSYSNKVKMIYIDPPYNTGKDFVYKDNYKDNLKNYQQVTGQVDDDGNKISTNSDSDGRYHSNWLNMMYPRLRLARNLLREDGVIFISIDDNEVDNLRKICDEVFGEYNFRGSIIRATGTTTGQDAKKIGSSYDYCLSYSKGSLFTLKGLPLLGKDLNRFNNDDNDGKGKYALLQLRKTGNADRKEDRENMFFPIEAPDGTLVYPIGPTDYLSRWRVGKDTFSEFLKENLIVWKENELNEEENLDMEDDEDNDEVQLTSNSNFTNYQSEENIDKYKSKWRPYVKYYLSGRTKQVSNLWTDIDGNKKGSIELKNLFIKKNLFDNPKPTDFLNRLMVVSINPNDIVLDFFAGSSSTAHSVMKLNTDGGNRKFILIQIPQITDEKSEAYKSGYKTLTELGKERIRRAGKKIKEENPLFSNILDTGFMVFKLDSSNIKGWDGLPDNLENSLFESQDNIKSDRTEEDVLFEILLKYGLNLTLPIEEKVIEGKKVFNVGFGALFICLGNELTSKVAEGIGQWKETLKPETCRVIFKDGGFTDVEKTNSVQTLKRFGIQEIKSI